MEPDTRLVERFRIVDLAETGGMGAVYRAIDELSGERVALKVMAGATDSDARRRFEREVSILARLAHPAVVSYLAHGVTPHGAPFLAMPWLEGESVEARLTHKGFTVAQALAAARRAAEGLAAAHALGIVHRDIKPSNLFLVGGEPAALVILDFGVARLPRSSLALTAQGALVGTVGYLSPEQASGALEVGPASDVFALGCVLYECLTGEPTFRGNTALEVLASLLLHEPEPLCLLRPDLGEPLEQLVDRMLQKDPERRFTDAGQLLEALAALPAGDASSARPVALRAAALTTDERRLLSIVLAVDDPQGLSTETTLSGVELARTFTSLRAEVARFGAQLAPLEGGGVLATLSGRGSAVDQAAHAAKCALAVSRLMPQARVALATGRAETLGGSTAGPVVERASHLVRTVGEPDAVVVDETTATLLETRFELERVAGGARLRRERDELFPVRRLAGKRAPFVGRDKELALLAATWAEAVEEAMVRAVLVFGEAGVGKSRLCGELIEHVQADVLVARADSFNEGGSLELARQLLRGACRELELSSHLAHIGVPDEDVPYLHEIAGVAFEPSAEVRSVLGDPAVARARLEAAFSGWLAALAARSPLLVVLEDLHWGDVPSLSMIESAARRLEGCALMLLGTSREDAPLRVDWRALDAQTLRLGGLTPGAARRMVKTVLGDKLDDAALAALVERAAGNPFFLEELVRQRAVAPASAELPDTVIAVAQARIDALDGGARRLLRAASVMGESFRSEAVASLLGSTVEVVEAQLAFLQERELCVREGPGLHRFAHALLRDAAYAMLTPQDERVGHRLAAAWLAEQPAPDPAAMAAHLERAGLLAEALPWLRRAAGAAIMTGDLQRAVLLADRGIAAGAEGEALGELLVTKVNALGWLGRYQELLEPAARAMQQVSPGSTAWFRAASTLLFAGASLGRPELGLDIVATLSQLASDPAPSGPYGRTMNVLVSGLLLYGQREMARQLLARLERSCTRSDDPLFELWVSMARTQVALYMENDLGLALEQAQRARGLLERVRDPLADTIQRATHARILLEMGAVDSATPMAATASALAAEMGSAVIAVWAGATHCAALAMAGRHDEARRRADALVAAAVKADAGFAKMALAYVLLMAGDAQHAEECARDAMAASPAVRMVRLSGYAVAGAAALALGCCERALEDVEEGMALHEAFGGVPRDVSLLHITRARALHELGRHDEALACARLACARFARLAEGIADESLRQDFHDRAYLYRESSELLARLERS